MLNRRKIIIRFFGYLRVAPCICSIEQMRREKMKNRVTFTPRTKFQNAENENALACSVKILLWKEKFPTRPDHYFRRYFTIIDTILRMQSYSGPSAGYYIFFRIISRFYCTFTRDRFKTLLYLYTSLQMTRRVKL